MIKKIFILYLLNAFILAQLSVGGNTELKFGESKNNYNFSEVFLNLSISTDMISTWSQFEYSDPPELGKKTNGLRKFRLDYSNGPLELSVGDIYKLWGRGLILNQFDDQNVNLDNGYRGLSFGLIEDDYSLNLISGLSNIARVTTDYTSDLDSELRVPNHLSNHSLFGGDVELFRGSFNFGLSFLQSRQSHPIFNSLDFQVDTLSLVHRTHGLRGGYNGSAISGYFEYANKSTILPESIINDTYADAYNPYNGFSLFTNLNYPPTTDPPHGDRSPAAEI